jgi:hypothetical protein
MLKHRPAPRSCCCGVACVLALQAAALPLAAQAAAGSLGGTLIARDARSPIEGARMTVLGTPLITSTDSAGRFEFLAVPAGVRVVQARAVGYAVGSWVVQLAEGQIFRQHLELESYAVEVPGLTVTGRDRTNWRSESGFEERRRRSTGYFITREEIANRHAQSLTDLLRSVPGVQTSCRNRACQVVMSRSTRQCAPEYFLDGYPASLATGPNFPINQIRGVEVYRSEFETPIEFQRFGLRCGVIAIWTVEPGEPLNRPRPDAPGQRPPPRPRADATPAIRP